MRGIRSHILGLGLGAGDGNTLLSSKVEKVVTAGETLAVILMSQCINENSVFQMSALTRKRDPATVQSP